MPCNHVIEVHNETGMVVVVQEDGTETTLTAYFRCNYCPLCGERIPDSEQEVSDE